MRSGQKLQKLESIVYMSKVPAQNDISWNCPGRGCKPESDAMSLEVG